MNDKLKGQLDKILEVYRTRYNGPQDTPMYLEGLINTTMDRLPPYTEAQKYFNEGVLDIRSGHDIDKIVTDVTEMLLRDNFGMSKNQEIEHHKKTLLRPPYLTGLGMGDMKNVGG